jgi:hypothetical protein
MRIPTRLRLSRHGVYYFRNVVPKTVRAAFGGRREIKASLGTRLANLTPQSPTLREVLRCTGKKRENGLSRLLT